MKIDLTKLPDWAVIQVKKGDLDFFAKSLLDNTSNNTVKQIKEESEILTVEEAAAFLKIAKQTLYQMTSNNSIVFYKKNKLLYFRRSELITWLESGKQTVVVSTKQKGGKQ